MSVLTRSALDASPLADLHALASTLGIDGFRRLRKAELADAILARQGGDENGEAETEAATEVVARAPRSRRRRTAAKDADPAPVADDAADDEPAPRTPRPRRSRAKRDPEEQSAPEVAPLVEEEPVGVAATEEAGDMVEGVVELLGNGSGLLRVAPPGPSDDDVYISAAQARRCELVAGDRVSGRVRRARRSERHPSLIRVETINGVAADEAVRATRLEDLPADFPSAVLALGDADPTLAAIGLFAPFGRGSRVVLAGGARSGKTESLKRVAGALAEIAELELEVLLVGIRPEELAEWKESPIATVTGLSFAAGADAQGSAVEQAVERARRVAARGGDAVLLIDTLDGVHTAVARRTLAAARNVRDGGSLTVIATVERPLGGETTVVVLDPARVARGEIPALDPIASGTIRPELLVGVEGYQAIVNARTTS